MIHVQSSPLEHAGWLSKRTGSAFTWEFRGIEAIDDSGRIAGMVGFDQWTSTSAQMAVAVDSPAACKTLLVEAFQYLFIETGRSLAIAFVHADNERSLRLVRKAGFIEAHRIPNGSKIGVDVILFQMGRDKCRWIRPDASRKAA